VQRRHRAAGPAWRTADPAWDDPLDPTYARRTGGRWNAPGSVNTLYLSESERVARLNAQLQITRRLAGMPFTFDDLDLDAMPDLVEVDVEDTTLCDCRTARGLRAVSLPAGYPTGDDGRPVSWSRCQEIGALVVARGLAGIAARSAAPGATHRDAELVLYTDRGPGLRAVTTRPFRDWFDSDGGIGR
jgi:RES domain-containing protein